MGNRRAVLLGARSVRYGFNTLVMVVLVLGIIGVVEALSYRHNARLDLTENRRHSLSSQTIQLLRGLTMKVSAVAFYRSDQPGKRLAEDQFKQYARFAGDKFTWKSVDPDREPQLAKAFGVEAYGTTVLEAKGRTEKVLDAEQEEKLTNGLVKVTREGKRVVWRELSIRTPARSCSDRGGYSQAKEALDKANYEAKRRGGQPQAGGRRLRRHGGGAPQRFLPSRDRCARRVPGPRRQAAGHDQPALPRQEPA